MSLRVELELKGEEREKEKKSDIIVKKRRSVWTEEGLEYYYSKSKGRSHEERKQKNIERV